MITRINYHLRNTAASLRMAADELDRATQVGYENQPDYKEPKRSGNHGCGCNPLPMATSQAVAPLSSMCTMPHAPYEPLGCSREHVSDDNWDGIMRNLQQGNKIQAIKGLRCMFAGKSMGLKDAKAIADILYTYVGPKQPPLPPL